MLKSCPSSAQQHPWSLSIWKPVDTVVDYSGFSNRVTVTQFPKARTWQLVIFSFEIYQYIAYLGLFLDSIPIHRILGNSIAALGQISGRVEILPIFCAATFLVAWHLLWKPVDTVVDYSGFSNRVTITKFPKARTWRLVIFVCSLQICKFVANCCSGQPFCSLPPRQLFFCKLLLPTTFCKLSLGISFKIWIVIFNCGNWRF